MTEFIINLLVSLPGILLKIPYRTIQINKDMRVFFRALDYSAAKVYFFLQNHKGSINWDATSRSVEANHTTF